MATVISFVSQKGGVGKTTSAVNLATAFAVGGFSVLLIDLDPQGSVRFSMGVKNKKNFGTKEIFTEPDRSISDLVHKTEEHESLNFIFSNIDKLKEEKEVNEICDSADFLYKRIGDVSKEYDYIIVDAPGATSPLAVNAIYASDLTILPLQCESLAVKSLKRFLVSFNELQQKNKTTKQLKLAGILLTMFDRSIEIHRTVSRQIYTALSDSVFETIIPRNDAIVEASALGKSVLTYKVNSIGATAYIRFMNEILDKFSLR